MIMVIVARSWIDAATQSNKRPWRLDARDFL
jgi:hypothetical protein